MSNVRNRNRMVYFRVSEDEFKQFKDLCARHGARNMSDLVRSAIKALTSHRSDGFATEVAVRLQQLENSVERLSQTISQNPSEPQV